MLQFYIKAIIANQGNIYSDHTIYLFNDENSYLLPMSIGPRAAESIILAQQRFPEPRPHIHNTAMRIAKALGADITAIIINRFEDEIFYAHIRLEKEGKVYDIDSKPSDAISIALRSKSPIYIEEEVLKDAGIKITKDLIEKSLDI